MCSLFLLITRPRNFEWRNLIGGLVKCGAQHFVEITQYWCQGWLVHRRIYWVHQHKAPIQASNVFLWRSSEVGWAAQTANAFGPHTAPICHGLS